MVANYRRAIAGAAVAVAVFAAAQAGLDIPAGVGEALVTLVVFGLGFLPRPSEPSKSQESQPASE